MAGWLEFYLHCGASTLWVLGWLLIPEWLSCGFAFPYCLFAVAVAVAVAVVDGF